MDLCYCAQEVRHTGTHKLHHCSDTVESGSMDDRQPLVKLNVYDLAEQNAYLYWAGVGIFHSGVEVYGVEFAYGGTNNPPPPPGHGWPYINCL